MERRQFLGAAAALSALPLSETGPAPSRDREPGTQQCDVCGADKPAEMVDRTAVPAIAPLEADVCRPCQLVQDHALPDGACMECGADLDGAGFEIELEHPLGPANLPALKVGTLCGECAGWIASDINYRGLRADDEAHAAFVDVLDEETARLNAREAGDE